MKELFTIDKENGEIVTKVRLDREEKKVCEILLFFFIGDYYRVFG